MPVIFISLVESVEYFLCYNSVFYTDEFAFPIVFHSGLKIDNKKSWCFWNRVVSFYFGILELFWCKLVILAFGNLSREFSGYRGKKMWFQKKCNGSFIRNNLHLKYSLSLQKLECNLNQLAIPELIRTCLKYHKPSLETLKLVETWMEHGTIENQELVIIAVHYCTSALL